MDLKVEQAADRRVSSLSPGSSRRHGEASHERSVLSLARSARPRAPGSRCSESQRVHRGPGTAACKCSR